MLFALFIFRPSVSRLAEDYTVIKMLGNGGYGKVFHVRHKTDGMEYAVKVVGVRGK
jgi:serine/threonine protein kinase